MITSLEGYRTMLVAVLGAIAQVLGIEFDVDGTAQGLIAVGTLVLTLYFRFLGTKREEALQAKVDAKT